MRDKTRFKVVKQLEFEMEAVDQSEADECVTQWLSVELGNRSNIFDIVYLGEKSLPRETFNKLDESCG